MCHKTCNLLSCSFLIFAFLQSWTLSPTVSYKENDLHIPVDSDNINFLLLKREKPSPLWHKLQNKDCLTTGSSINWFILNTKKFSSSFPPDSIFSPRLKKTMFLCYLMFAFSKTLSLSLSSRLRNRLYSLREYYFIDS